MALGGNGSSNPNNNGKKNYNKEYYSQYGYSNIDGVESSKLTYSIWAKKMLKITISPQKKVNDDSIAFDYENNISIYLTHTKALILLHMIEDVWEKKNNRTGNVGVNTGSGGLITVSDGSEYGISSPCITISALDNSGNATSRYCYTTRDNYYYGIENFNNDTKDFEKEFFKYLEIEQLKIMLRSYVESATSCIAASVAEEMSYSIRNIQETSNAIAEQIGAKAPSGSNKQYSNNTFFSGGGNSSSDESKPARTGSIEDLDDGM